MPACFCLFPHGSKTPAKFSDIDDAMRAHFGADPDPKHYYESWFDIEGLGLALGRSFADLRRLVPERTPIIDWLDANYSPEAWTEVGRR